MYGTIGIRSSTLPSKAAATKLTRTAQELCNGTKRVSFATPVSYVLARPNATAQKRQFSSTSRTQLSAFPPPANAPNVKVTAPAWRHPV